MKRCCLWLMLLSASMLPLDAQTFPRFEVFGGYRHSSFSDGPFQTVSGNGWNAGAGFNFSQWLGVKGDFSSANGTDHATAGHPFSVTNSTFTFGPVITVRTFRRINPFAEVLFGSYHETLPRKLSYTGFAVLAGGGVDLNVFPRWAVRLGPFDLQHLQAPSGALLWKSNTARLGAGIVVRF